MNPWNLWDINRQRPWLNDSENDSETILEENWQLIPT
jgi:hypothetical protein